ncbi:MAG: hypothetical protein IJB82_02950 [Bacilli bacterium]|nr:hypothetical protein [Bacilli bacterium]
MKKVIILFSMLLFLNGCENADTIEFNLQTKVGDNYEWIYEIEDESILIIESLESELENTLNGSYTDYNFEFSALKKGVTNITFNYIDENNDILHTMVYEIKVDALKNIKVIDKKGSYINKNLPIPEIDD